MPADYTYQPLLHHLVAAVSALTGFTEARSYHLTVGFIYCLGPVTLYALVFSLTRQTGLSLFMGVTYSLISFSPFLIPAIQKDIGGIFLMRRLHTVVAYGDGPYVTSLTFIPLAILFLHRALATPSLQRWIVASIAIAVVPLTNIPGALSMAMAFVSFILALNWRSWNSKIFQTLGMSITGFVLFAPLLSPSSLLLMAHNVQWMNPEGRFSVERIGYYFLFGAVLVGVTALLHRLQTSFYLRFALLFSFITSGVVLLEALLGISLIGQATRFHLAMDMALVLLLGSFAAMIHYTPKTRQILIIVIGIISLAQIVHLRKFSKEIMTPAADITSRSEYRVAQWMSENANGARVIVPGSTSFWLNYWTATPQVTGCCDQGTLLRAPAITKHVLGILNTLGSLTEYQKAEIALSWMKTLGVRYINISSDASTEVYKDFHCSELFDGILPARWRDNGEIIYEVPDVTSLAHVIRHHEAISRIPENGIDIDPLQPYIAAISDRNRPAATFQWISNRSAVIHSTVQPKELISVQIPFHQGWNASSPQGPVALAKDALGLLLLQPLCHGECEIRLTFGGGTEAKILRLIATCSWTLLAIFLAIRFYRTRH